MKQFLNEYEKLNEYYLYEFPDNNGNISIIEKLRNKNLDYVRVLKDSGKYYSGEIFSFSFVNVVQKILNKDMKKYYPQYLI